MSGWKTKRAGGRRCRRKHQLKKKLKREEEKKEKQKNYWKCHRQYDESSSESVSLTYSASQSVSQPLLLKRIMNSKRWVERPWTFVKWERAKMTSNKNDENNTSTTNTTIIIIVIIVITEICRRCEWYRNEHRGLFSSVEFFLCKIHLNIYSMRFSLFGKTETDKKFKEKKNFFEAKIFEGKLVWPPIWEPNDGAVKKFDLETHGGRTFASCEQEEIFSAQIKEKMAIEGREMGRHVICGRGWCPDHATRSVKINCDEYVYLNIYLYENNFLVKEIKRK